MARKRADEILHGLDDEVTLGGALRKIADQLKDSSVSGVCELNDKVQGISGRDENDKKRLLKLYGVDYQERGVFDLVIDTNGKAPVEVQQIILEKVSMQIVHAKFLANSYAPK